ncbi:hypothetical protein BWG23_11755 [Flavobacterium oreochromis]|nr:hypothetical protein BWG23_11755 [Flavobacterium oreochromis]
MIRGLRLLPIKISISDFYKKDFLGLPSTIISDVFTYGFLNASQIFHDAIKKDQYQKLWRNSNYA